MTQSRQYEFSDDDALLHYGVLGMKWGVRKDRGSTGDGTPRQSGKERRLEKRLDAGNRVYSTKSKRGKDVHVNVQRSKLKSALSKTFPKYAKYAESFDYLSVKNASGRTTSYDAAGITLTRNRKEARVVDMTAAKCRLMGYFI